MFELKSKKTKEEPKPEPKIELDRTGIWYDFVYMDYTTLKYDAIKMTEYQKLHSDAEPTFAVKALSTTVYWFKRKGPGSTFLEDEKNKTQ